MEFLNKLINIADKSGQIALTIEVEGKLFSVIVKRGGLSKEDALKPWERR